MKGLGISTLCAAALLAAGAAHADSVTFAGSGRAINQVMVPVAGAKPVGGVFSESNYDVTLASGKKVATKSQCAGWTPEPGSMFSTTGACTVSDSTGTYSTLFSCQNDAKGTSGDCWGKLTGMSGAYAGRNGTASWHGVLSADGKTNTFSGVAMWD